MNRKQLDFIRFIYIFYSKHKILNRIGISRDHRENILRKIKTGYLINDVIWTFLDKYLIRNINDVKS